MLNRLAEPGAPLPLVCMCGAALRVDETREDPDNLTAPCVWRVRSCSGRGIGADRHTIATVQFHSGLTLKGVPGERMHQCLDCGARFASVERQVSLAEARERLAHLARERVMLARAGRRDPWASTRELPPTVAWHLEGR